MPGEGAQEAANWRLRRRLVWAHIRACRAWRDLPGKSWTELAQLLGPGPQASSEHCHGLVVRGVG